MNAAAQPWVESAHRSLAAAEVLHAAQLWPQTCFNAQQCVELMFKAAIVSTGIAPPRIHDLVELSSRLDPLAQDALRHLTAPLSTLDLYYTPMRYPDAQPGALPYGLPQEPDATAALSTAREVVAILEPRIRAPQPDEQGGSS